MYKIMKKKKSIITGNYAVQEQCFFLKRIMKVCGSKHVLLYL